MSNRRSVAYVALGALLTCVVISVLFSLSIRSDPPNPSSTPRPTFVATPYQRRPTATPTVNDSILAAIGRPNRDDAPAPRVIIAGDERVGVFFGAQDAWDGPAIHRQTQRQIVAIARVVREHTQSDLKIVVTFPLTDKYGNSQEATVLRAQLSRATLERINFDNFRPADLPTIADFYWQHPALAD